jgi:CTP:molybdopterin cytidylyltransferase MocA
MIVIPMAGASRRFTEAGYQRPKYELPLHGRTVFEHAVRSFEAQFQSNAFLFVTGPQAGASDFVTRSCRDLGVASFKIASLRAATAGQAETVELGLR